MAFQFQYADCSNGTTHCSTFLAEMSCYNLPEHAITLAACAFDARYSTVIYSLGALMDWSSLAR